MKRDKESGAAAVEFALVLPLLCLTLFGAIDFGRMMFCRSQLSYATAEGARTASVMGTSTSTDVQNHMIAVVPFLALTTSQITVTNTTSSTRGFTSRQTGDMIQISTTYNFNPLFGSFFSFLRKTWVSTVTTPAQ